jgi:hypothetical protein
MQQSLMKPVTNLVTQPGDPTSVTEWPPQPPLLLTEEQSDNLGTWYTIHDMQRLMEAGFKKIVEERMQRTDFHPRVKKLRHKATARLLNHLKEGGSNLALSIPPWMNQQHKETLQ